MGIFLKEQSVSPAQVTGEDQAVFIARIHVAIREARMFQKSKYRDLVS